MSRPSKKVLHLADLQRFIFTDDYNSQVAATGEHELTFVTSEGTSVDCSWLAHTHWSRFEGFR